MDYHRRETFKGFAPVFVSMPNRPLSPCAVRTCRGRATNGRYCVDHAHLNKQSRKPDTRPSASARGYDRKWQRIAAAHKKAHPHCVVCGEPVEHTDHIVPRSQGGSDKWENLQSLCHSCHSQKTVYLDGGFGNARSLPDKQRDRTPRKFKTYRPFALRTRDRTSRGSQTCVHVVGGTGTGKSYVLNLLQKQLGIPGFSIDEERAKLIGSSNRWVNDEQELMAWVALEDAVDAVELSAVETSGHNLNANVMLDGRHVFTILCVASDEARRERLKQRVDHGYILPTGVGIGERLLGLADYGYVDKLMKIDQPDVPANFIWNSEKPNDEMESRLLFSLGEYLSKHFDGRGDLKVPSLL